MAIPYTQDFYKKVEESSRQAAKEVIPILLKLIQPKSVIDVGCGAGTWLSVFKECGIEDIWGIDGDWLDKSMLQIPPERFLAFDLKKTFQIDRQFDLVTSIEVAEHIPSGCAEVFVNSLIKLGPVILFSAAIPFQGGSDHVNEQWPDYWAGLFQKKGYAAIDCIRKKIWQNHRIKPWYAQNILLFARQDYLEVNFLLKEEFKHTNAMQLSMVHPAEYLRAIKRADELSDPRNMSLRKTISILPILTINALKRRIKR